MVTNKNGKYLCAIKLNKLNILNVSSAIARDEIQKLFQVLDVNIGLNTVFILEYGFFSL